MFFGTRRMVGWYNGLSVNNVVTLIDVMYRCISMLRIQRLYHGLYCKDYSIVDEN